HTPAAGVDIGRRQAGTTGNDRDRFTGPEFRHGGRHERVAKGTRHHRSPRSPFSPRGPIGPDFPSGPCFPSRPDFTASCHAREAAPDSPGFAVVVSFAYHVDPPQVAISPCSY